MHHHSWPRRSLLLLGVCLGLLLIGMLYANSGKVPVPFTSLAHDQNLGRPYNRYIVGVPDLLVIADPSDVDQLDTYLRLGAPHDRYPLSILEALHQLDYTRDFALLALQGMSGGNSHVTIQQIIRQGGRVLVQAEFVTPRPGEGQTGNGTDAYHLVAVERAGFTGQQLHFELWDGWQKRKEVGAYLIDVLDVPAQPTPTPIVPLKGTPIPGSDYPAPTPDQRVATPAYPAPTPLAYPKPSAATSDRREM